ncbi:hypothetical protein J1N35_002029 [Gossypium stocksii]|uniref:Uncharacterized protein n=1 Tax=Gossypium stocksii TaxID=47602 RepID=A0A9D4ALV6_9ROSI|nr:hypothetical protein J1N35_002029 [Gossypium stocksii]
MGHRSNPMTIAHKASYGGQLIKWGSFDPLELVRFVEQMEKLIYLKPWWPNECLREFLKEFSFSKNNVLAVSREIRDGTKVFLAIQLAKDVLRGGNIDLVDRSAMKTSLEMLEVGLPPMREVGCASNFRGKIMMQNWAIKQSKCYELGVNNEITTLRAQYLDMLPYDMPLPTASISSTHSDITNIQLG